MNLSAQQHQSLSNRRILVVGLGATGLSVCEFLSAQGIAYDAVDTSDSPPGAQTVLALTGRKDSVHCGFSEQLFDDYDFFVVSPGVALDQPLFNRVRAQGARVIGDIELFAMVVNAPVIAITGSNGKSTVASWLHSVFSTAGIRSVLCGNIGKPALGALVENADIYVLELSSFQLESVDTLRPLAATVLNVSEDHMDRYESLEHYAAVKRRIYRDSQMCVVNAADPRTEPERHDNIVRFSLGTARDNEYGISESDNQRWLVGPRFRLLPITDVPLPGPHNLLNALAVAALADSLELTEQQVQKGLKSFLGLPHRTELVAHKDDIRWFNDSKGTNVDACLKAVEAMSGPVVLIMGGIGKDADFRPLSDIIKRKVKALILIGRDAPLIEKTLGQLVPTHCAADMRAAVECAAQLSSPGDCVLLSPACSSFDMFQSYEHRGEMFSKEVQRVAA